MLMQLRSQLGILISMPFGYIWIEKRSNLEKKNNGGEEKGHKVEEEEGVALV